MKIYKILKILVSSTFILILSSFLSYSQEVEKIDTSKLDVYIRQEMKKWRIPGLAISVVQKGKVTFEKGYGTRNIETQQPVTPNTIFPIASNTKQFSVAALSVLEDEYKIRWDDPVRKYLPQFTLYDLYVSENVTIRDILSHRTGLKAFDRDLFWYGSLYSRKEILQQAKHIKHTNPFRYEFGYSNIMYIAAGEIITAVTGVSWDDFVSKHIFKPLKMYNSNTSVKNFKKSDNVSYPHFVNFGTETKLLPLFNCDNLGSSGAINSSVRDMSHWLIMQLNNGVYEGKRILSERQIRIMRTPNIIIPINPSKGEPLEGQYFKAYTMGLYTFQYNGMQVFMHRGMVNANLSITCMVPQKDFGIVILLNCYSKLHEALMYYILDLITGKEPKNWSKYFYMNDYQGVYNSRKNQYNKYNEEIKKEQQGKNIAASHSLETYTGIYRHPLYGFIEIKQEKDKLVLDFISSRIISGNLSHFMYNSFLLESPSRPDILGGIVSFKLGAYGEVSELTIFVYEPYNYFKRILNFKRSGLRKFQIKALKAKRDSLIVND